jgi:membrane associated rhomboid family serine protease
VIPIHDVNPTRRFAWVTLVLVVANVAVFLLWQPTFQDQQAQQAFFFCHAEIPWEVSHQTNLAEGGAAARSAIQADYQVSAEEAAGLQEFLQQRCPGKNWLLSVFVAMFLHGGWLHIAGNMLFLWVFGNNVEDRLGRPLFIVFYLLGGIAAAALQLAFDPSSAVPSLGASGAVAAVLGAYLVMFPRAWVVTLVILLLFITAVELPAVLVLGAWFVLQLFSGVGGLAAEVNAGVAYWAHVGGFVFGLGAAALLFRGRGRRAAAGVPAAARLILSGRGQVQRCSQARWAAACRELTPAWPWPPTAKQATRSSVRNRGDLADQVASTGYRQRSQTTTTPPGRPSAPGRTRTRPSSTRWPVLAGPRHAGAVPWCQVPSGSAQGTPPTS